MVGGFQRSTGTPTRTTRSTSFEGELVFTVDGEELVAGPETFVLVPPEIDHSFENRTDRPRRATVINVFKDGTFSDSDQPLLTGVPVVPKGEPIRGQFFPLLFAGLNEVAS